MPEFFQLNKLPMREESREMDGKSVTIAFLSRPKNSLRSALCADQREFLDTIQFKGWNAERADHMHYL